MFAVRAEVRRARSLKWPGVLLSESVEEGEQFVICLEAACPLTFHRSYSCQRGFLKREMGMKVSLR